MVYPKDYPDEGQKLICDHVRRRLFSLGNNDREALEAEFKEWLAEETFDQGDLWSIPDLSDDGLRDFFCRAISQD